MLKFNDVNDLFSIESDYYFGITKFRDLLCFYLENRTMNQLASSINSASDSALTLKRIKLLATSIARPPP